MINSSTTIYPSQIYFPFYSTSITSSQKRQIQSSLLKRAKGINKKMWMMGYNDGGELNSNNIQDAFNNRRLRNLMPRPAIASASANPPCLIHGSDHLLALNAAMAEHNKRELNTQQVVVSSRWNPTPEQLQTLEELYRRGTRTPSADQIQHITSQLRRYGKIEGKNVFYWFQNHKARERQKRRRQLESSSDDNNNNPNGEKKESLTGANRTLHEVEQTKNWASPTNSSTIAPQSVSKQGGAKASDGAECKADGWVQFDHDEAELLQRGKNASWRMMNLSCSNSSPTNLINSSSAPILTTATTIPSTAMGQDDKFVNMFLEPYQSAQNLHHGGDGEAQTLELFPLMSGSRRRTNDEREEEEEDSRTPINSASTITPYPYFEFLPLKN